MIANFKYISEKNNVVIRSFELKLDDGDTLTFMSHNHEDLFKIYEILKKKINLGGFHENFRAVKRIGKGNFAIVKIFKK